MTFIFYRWLHFSLSKSWFYQKDGPLYLGFPCTMASQTEKAHFWCRMPPFSRLDLSVTMVPDADHTKPFQWIYFKAFNKTHWLWDSLIARRGCGCPLTGGTQGQVGWSPGQPGLVLNREVGGPACGRGRWRFMDSWGPFQPRPPCDSDSVTSKSIHTICLHVGTSLTLQMKVPIWFSLTSMPQDEQDKSSQPTLTELEVGNPQWLPNSG